MSLNVLPILSSKSFIVYAPTFRSLIHFEFIFVYGVRKCSNFILSHVAVQFSQHHLLKRLSLPHCIFLPPLSKISAHRCMGLFLGFLYCSLVYVSLFVPVPYCLDYSGFVVCYEGRKVDSPVLFFFLEITLAI